MMRLVIIKKKIWDLIMIFVITNGFGGAVLLIQDVLARGMRLTNRGCGTLTAEECAA